MSTTEESIITESMENMNIVEITDILRFDQVLNLIENFINENNYDRRNINTMVSLAYQMNGGDLVGQFLGHRDRSGNYAKIKHESLLYDKNSILELIVIYSDKIRELQKQASDANTNQRI